MPDIKNPMTAWAIIQGRVCHTPKISAGEKPHATFSIAHDYWEKDRENGGTVKKADFFDVVAFGYAARDAEKLTRGENVQVTGTLRIEQWKGANDTPRTSVKVLADTVRSMQWPAKDGGVPEVADLEPKTADEDIPF